MVIDRVLHCANMQTFCETLWQEGPTQDKSRRPTQISINEFLNNLQVQCALSDTQQATASESTESPAKRIRVQLI